MIAAHGAIPGGRLALIAMGKAGSRELTAGSDVDLILIYDHDDGDSESDGPRPLDPTRYYARLTQRLIAALSAPTAEGVLYAVDMRLRPSGNKGPVATRLPTFARYQREEAWTWEHLALTRARAIAGDAGLMAAAGAVFASVLAAPRDPRQTAKDVAEMRALIDKEKAPEGSWDLKLVPGGLVDLEFCAQFMMLMAAERGIAAPSSGTPTLTVLERLAPHFLKAEEAETLIRALRLMTALSQVLRLCLDDPFRPEGAPAGLIDLLCRAGDAPDLKVLEAELRSLTKSVRRIFLALVAA